MQAQQSMLMLRPEHDYRTHGSSGTICAGGKAAWEVVHLQVVFCVLQLENPEGW